MTRAAIITTVVVGATVMGLLALAAPAVAGAASWADRFLPPAPSASAQADADAEAAVSDALAPLGDGGSVAAGGPGDCTTSARIDTRGEGASAPRFSELRGELVENGPSALASGTSILDAGGAIVAYEVAPGDSLIAIGERFCVDYMSVGNHNHVKGHGLISPGDVLFLRPDPTLPWVDPYMPYDVKPGDFTGPYYDAVEELSRAVAARDLATARSVWHRLGPEVDPAASAVAAEALAESDWMLLRQMFP